MPDTPTKVGLTTNRALQQLNQYSNSGRLRQTRQPQAEDELNADRMNT
jgi:hypothetical protein